MYEKQCAMHTLYDCFVNVPLGKLEVEKFQGGGGFEIFSGGV